MVRFVEKKIDEPTWISQPQKFGFIPNLHLEMLEIKEKIKPNAPIIPDSTYSNMHIVEEKAPEPTGGQKPLIEEMKSVSEKSVEDKGVTESQDSINSEDAEILEQFAESEEELSEEESKEIIVEAVEEIEEEISENTQLAKNEVEKRFLRKKCRELNIEFEESDSLQTLRLSVEMHEKDKQSQEVKSGSVTTNKMLLSLLFLASDGGLSWYDSKLDGYLSYQMKLMPHYEVLFSKMDDTQIADFIFRLPPEAQLMIAVGLSSVGFIGMKKWGLEEKIKNTKFLEGFIPGYGKAIDAMSEAIQPEKPSEQEQPRSRRGPSVRAEDISRM